VNNTFGDYIRSQRLNDGFGQRELARLLGISASYLNDLEQSKRPAPSEEILMLLKNALSVDDTVFNDLAGKSKRMLPPDIQKFLMGNDAAFSLIRVLGNLDFPQRKIDELKKMVTEQNYKAIIVAAGLGSRLSQLTKETPKCLLELNGKSILQHQLDAYRSNGVNDISVVRGYKKEKINLPGLKYYDNIDFVNNNILNSLFYAEQELQDNVIVSYSDIIFAPRIVERLLDSSADISIVVDVDWRGRYENRDQHPIEEAENVVVDANLSVLDIGKIMTNPGDVFGEFIGMLKFSPRGVEVFKRHFHRAKDLFWGKPFQRAETFQKAYITDILKDMAELGVNIHTVIIEQGWQEIDTIEDYENTQIKMKKEGL